MKLLSIFACILGLLKLSECFIPKACHRDQRKKSLVQQDRTFLFASKPEETITDDFILKSLKDRQKAISHGIGRRYITRTQKGFLNVHSKPTDPYDVENIVSQLTEDQIVTSTGSSKGDWIPHDAGGWSISKFGGFTWLEPIEE
mmetsp:Transcript_18639/g.27624  ORF Transcript_18639/g.27624 Transcript_18639/m.27624 type:complete len:144 (+) Transcript_18639:1-432(+)